MENHGIVESVYGDVFLIGSRVVNSGSVQARNGTAGLAAGREVVINPAGSADGRLTVVATEAISISPGLTMRRRCLTAGSGSPPPAR